MLILSVILVICFIVFISNVLFYTISLLFISISLLLFIVLINYVSTLLFLLIVIVYVGAIIILIGYICAVCPNFVTNFSSNYFLITLFMGFFYTIILSLDYRQNSSKLGSLSDYFFSLWGSPVFFLIAIMLFITLIIVTSQYSSPQGPFRSLQ